MAAKITRTVGFTSVFVKNKESGAVVWEEHFSGDIGVLKATNKVKNNPEFKKAVPDFTTVDVNVTASEELREMSLDDFLKYSKVVE